MAAADVTALQALRTQIITQMAAFLASPTPDVSDQGRSVSWGSYFNLLNQLKEIDALIQAAEGPFMVTRHGRPV